MCIRTGSNLCTIIEYLEWLFRMGQLPIQRPTLSQTHSSWEMLYIIHVARLPCPSWWSYKLMYSTNNSSSTNINLNRINRPNNPRTWFSYGSMMTIKRGIFRRFLNTTLNSLQKHDLHRDVKICVKQNSLNTYEAFSDLPSKELSRLQLTSLCAVQQWTGSEVFTESPDTVTRCGSFIQALLIIQSWHFVTSVSESPWNLEIQNLLHVSL